MYTFAGGFMAGASPSPGRSVAQGARRGARLLWQHEGYLYVEVEKEGYMMWKGRFEEDTAQVVLEFTQSLDLDWRLYDHDIRGSVAHARMLGAAGLLTDDEVRQI
jgi:hypothetical protein